MRTGISPVAVITTTHPLSFQSASIAVAAVLYVGVVMMYRTHTTLDMAGKEPLATNTRAPKTIIRYFFFINDKFDNAIIVVVSSCRCRGCWYNEPAAAFLTEPII